MTVKMLLSFLFISTTLAQCPKSKLFMTAPTNMEALSGSCLLIPCNFSSEPEKEFNSSRTTFGVWIIKDSRFGQNPENVIFNSSKEENIYSMNITGNLVEKNCTTLFNNLSTIHLDKYYFRVENSPFMATAVCDPSQITIKDSPWKPTIIISGDLKEKESVTISCSALTPCPHSPPQLTWSLQQDAISQTEEKQDRTFTTKIQKTFTLSHSHDGLNISCSASYPVDGGRHKKSEANLTLDVSYAPKDTSASISPAGLVSAGNLVNLSCSSRAKPPISSFTWFKISPHGHIKMFDGDFYRFNVTDATDGGSFYCLAVNDLGNQTSNQVHLTIKGEDSGSSTQWEVVLGGVIGIVGLICLVVSVWWIKSKCRTQQPPQSQTSDEIIVDELTSKAEDTEENIHYGEIDFSNWRPKPGAGPVQDLDQPQQTVYAQVTVKHPALESGNGANQTADNPEDLYARVKKR